MPMPMPMPDPDLFDADFDWDIETTLRDVEGSVRVALIKKIQKLVEDNPEVFVSNLRDWLNVGRHDD